MRFAPSTILMKRKLVCFSSTLSETVKEELTVKAKSLGGIAVNSIQLKLQLNVQLLPILLQKATMTMTKVSGFGHLIKMQTKFWFIGGTILILTIHGFLQLQSSVLIQRYLKSIMVYGLLDRGL